MIAADLAKVQVWVAADAGFDSEVNHQLARDELGIQSLMPATHGRPGRDEPTGRYRRQMKRHLHESRYGQRWQVETLYSMVKRLSGDVVHARSYWRRCRLLLLKALTHNITILKRRIGFLLSRTFYFSFDVGPLIGWIADMPRTARASAGGICYHVLNRGNARAEVFHKDGD